MYLSAFANPYTSTVSLPQSVLDWIGIPVRHIVLDKSEKQFCSQPTTKFRNQAQIEVCDCNLEVVIWDSPKPEPLTRPHVSDTPYRKPNLDQFIVTISTPLVIPP